MPPKISEAAAAFTQVLRLKPLSATANYNLGVTLQELGVIQVRTGDKAGARLRALVASRRNAIPTAGHNLKAYKESGRGPKGRE